MAEVYQNLDEEEVYVPLIAETSNQGNPIEDLEKDQRIGSRKISISSIVIGVVFVAIIIVLALVISLSLASNKSSFGKQDQALEQEPEKKEPTKEGWKKMFRKTQKDK